MENAISEIKTAETAKFIAGGTNLLDLMKYNVEKPAHLVDVGRLPFDKIEEIENGLRLGALCTNAETAYDERVEKNYPMLSLAILNGASAQLRNAATNGGNLMQRTRCYYFYDDGKCRATNANPARAVRRLKVTTAFSPFWELREKCIATHPSDMCVALAALEATVNVQGNDGTRQIKFEDFHRLPGDTPEIDNNLKPDEIIISIDLPEKGFSENYTYLKLRDRQSYAFALVSVAVGLEMDGDKITDARIALGGVAHKPWRDKEAENLLKDKTATRENFGKVAEKIFADAKGFGANSFKIELGKRAVVRALEQAANGTPQPVADKADQIESRGNYDYKLHRKTGKPR